MSNKKVKDSQQRNLLLAALPDEDYQRLLPHLRPVFLRRGEVLHQSDSPANSVYFLDQGVAALSVSNSEGVEIELSIVGVESTVGERAIFKNDFFIIRCQMLTDGSGYKISAKMFEEEFERGGALHDLILSRLEAIITETAQTALCNQTHRAVERLSRWLLTLADRSHCEEIFLTQETIANLLGVNRSTISIASKLLLDKKIIDYNRGRITILDRAALEGETCECYKTIKQAIQTFDSIKRKS
jgi:CRP-like cAMP-binding protein